MRAPVRGSLRALTLAVVATVGAAPVAFAQDTGGSAEDLGDTGAPPPTAEDLGAVKPEPEEPPPPPRPKRKAEPKPEASPGDAASPTPSPTPPPKSRPTPAPAVPAPAPSAAPTTPAVAPDVAAKAREQKEQLIALLVAEPGDSRALDAAGGVAIPDPLLAAEPALRPYLKLVRARSLILQGRLDEAPAALTEARGLLGPLPTREARRVSAEVRYRQAEIEEAKSKAPPSCGALGLRKLSSLEGRRARQRIEELASDYRAVVKVGERFWSRRAAFRTAALYDEFYRRAIAAPEGFRGTPLPSPFAITRVDTRALVGDVLGGAWPAEISRLYSEVIASIDVREPDAILLKLVGDRAAAFARLELPPGERAENPWAVDEKPGLVRFNRRYERKGEGRAWAAVTAEDVKDGLAAALKAGPGTVEHAYALAARAEAGPAPTIDDVAAALKHADPRVQLAGLFAAEKHPSPSHLERLVELATAGAKDAPFSTLQLSLYGTRERALLALRALANKDRALAARILEDQRVPVRERAWIVAELGETSLQYTLQTLSRDRDPIVAATALYALALASGKNASGWLRPTEVGVVGCVSKAVTSFE